ncbi:MAG: ATP-binding protein [Bacteroidaceae bacterium]|nr:ATP-binding protein [Bacteroidaceae bacterium]MDE6721078.1 ATP-binding protein [Bacteroidaceae bacterium]
MMPKHLPLYTDISTDILNIVLRNNTTTIPQHLLVCGKTGCGKSHFLQYLAEQLRKEKRQTVVLSPPYTYRKETQSLISEVPVDTTKTTFLLIDDFDQLLEDLEIDEQYTLRAYLFKQGAPTLIGTCQQPPTATKDYKAPFYDAFRLFFLSPAPPLQMFFPSKVYGKLIADKGWEEAKPLIDGNIYYCQYFAQQYTKGKSINESIDHVLKENNRYFMLLFSSLSDSIQRTLAGIAACKKEATISDIRKLGKIEGSNVPSALLRLTEKAIIKQVGKRKRNYSYIMSDQLFAEWLRRHLFPSIPTE